MFRHGQWVTFKIIPPIEGIHQAPNGSCVGIFQKGGLDALGKTTLPSIFPVGKDGNNVVILVGGQAITVQLRLGEVQDLAPCTEADWLPESRRSHLPAGAKLPI